MADRRGLALAFTTAFLWGFGGVLIRLLSPLPAVMITGLRLTIAAAAVLPFVAWRWRELPFEDLRRKSTYFAAAMLVSYFFTAAMAFQRVPVAEVAVLLAAAPLLVLTFNVIRGVTVTRGEKFGALLAFCGVALVVLPGFTSGIVNLHRLSGDALAILSAGCTATFATMFARDHQGESRSADPTVVALTAFVLGGAITLIIGLLVTEPQKALLTTRTHLVPALLLGVFVTAAPSLAYSTASRRLPAVVTTTIQLLIPVVSVFAAAFILGEAPSFWVIPGGILVLGGIGIMVRSTRSKELAIAEEFTNV
jgi:drug/metabolite transporter (DMT)-like permease